jgi:multisubunit Na+/H+ antiporter MnhB subunit
MNPHKDEAELPETPFDEVTDLVGPEEEVREEPERRFHLSALMPMIFVIAILLSPIAALRAGLDFALGVLVVAMVFTTWMAWDGANQVPAEQGIRLRRAAMLNAVVAVAVLVLLILRQVV